MTPRQRPELVTDRDDVLASLGSRSTCLLNALASDLHTGERSRYGRPGHIPGSVNVPSPHSCTPRAAGSSRDALRERLAAAGALDGDRVVSYCGGGIAATLDAFAITLVGGPEVTVEDGSMTEWAADPALPMEPG